MYKMNGSIWQEDFYKVIWKLQHLGVCGSAWGTRSPLRTPLYSSSRQRRECGVTWKLCNGPDLKASSITSAPYPIGQHL